MKSNRQVTARGMMSTNLPSYCMSLNGLSPARNSVTRGLAFALTLAALPVLMSATALVSAQPAQAASPFSTVLKINDAVITQFELDQRILFLKLLRTPGDPSKEAMRGLTQDRLATGEAKRYGLKLTEKQIEQGMEEFAARANMDAKTLIGALGEAGVAKETFRDFVSAGLVWRELVRGKYASAASVSEAEIDRAIAQSVVPTGMQLLISELVMPIEGDPEPQLQKARELRAEITSEASFAAAAQRYSASGSAGRGGRLEWMSTSNLPPQIVQMLLALKPGQVSEPVQMQGAVAVFQLRDVKPEANSKPAVMELEYAQILLPNTADVTQVAAQIAASSDTCSALYPAAGKAQGAVSIQKKPAAAIAAEEATLLASLDPMEYSTALTRGGKRLMLVLCNRSPMATEEAPVDRAAVRERLLGDKLNLLAAGYYEELRSEAIIKGE